MRKSLADNLAKLSKPDAKELDTRNRESGLPSVVRVYSEELDTTNVSPSTAWVEFVDGAPRLVSLGQDGTFYELAPPTEELITEVSITADTTLGSDAFGKLHVCSGTSANYTVVLPPTSGNARRKIGFEMDSALTKLVTLDGNASELIDTALTRVMWAQEVAWLKVNAAGTAWTKIAGKTRPMLALMTLSASQSCAASPTVTKVNLDGIEIDSGGLGDTVNHQINILRPGTYELNGRLTFATGQTLPRAQVQVMKNTVLFAGGEDKTTVSTHIAAPAVARLAALVAGDIIDLRAYHEGAAANSVASGCRLSVEERPSW